MDGVPQLDHRLLYRVGRLTERRALRQIEADGDRRKLPLMADREWPHRHAGPGREGRQRHLIARGRRLHIDLVQRIEAALQLGQHFQDHVIAVELREVLRHLALAERIIQRVVDQLRLDAVARRLVAVDRQRQRRAVVCWSVATSRSSGRRLQLVQHLGRPVVQLADVGVLQRQLILRCATAGRRRARPAPPA